MNNANNCLMCQDQRTALMLAACSGSLEMVSLFLEKGADVNLRDKVGVAISVPACHMTIT